MSVQYSVEAAAALTLFGTVDHPDSFEYDRYLGSEALKLADLVEVVLDDEVDAAYPARMAARVRLELHGGDTGEEYCPGLEAVSEPAARRASAETKFRALTAGSSHPTSRTTSCASRWAWPTGPPRPQFWTRSREG